MMKHVLASPSIERRHLALDALAGRVGEELETLARVSTEIQRAISICKFADATDPNAIRGLQGIDRVTQALEDLGRLMAAVSSEMPRGIQLRALPILSHLRLHELVANLDPEQEKVLLRHEDDGEVMWL
ncbi:hypothetical protein SAMN05216224_106201 [Thioclava dalianensis]|nr:hypothetical protein SAMN05216224_106201 [Thioclava dalianensis]